MPDKILITVDKDDLQTLEKEVRVMEHLITYAETINHKEYLGKLVAEIKILLKNIEK